MKSFTISRLPAPTSAADIPELDVTPVMNMFVILIPFLVSMAVFTHLAVLKFSVPPNIGSNLGGDGKPKLKVTVVLAPTYVAITHGEQMLDSIPAPKGEYDFGQLESKLVVRRNQADIVDETVVAVRDEVPLKHIVAVMDRCRLAGFVKIGLSNAPQNPGKGV